MLARQQFGPLPTCIFGQVADLTTLTNYTDLWWNPERAGLGDQPRAPGRHDLRRVVHLRDGRHADVAGDDGGQDGAGHVRGRSLQHRRPGRTRRCRRRPVGAATFSFANGNSATFAYSVALPGMSGASDADEADHAADLHDARRRLPIVARSVTPESAPASGPSPRERTGGLRIAADKEKGRANCPAFLVGTPARGVTPPGCCSPACPSGPGVTSKRDLLAFLQRLESRHVDRREVREQIFAAAVRRNESETLGVVEPLHSTCCHFCNSSRKRKDIGTVSRPMFRSQGKNGNDCNAVA